MQINIGKILTGLLTFFVAVLEIILGMRFVLKLLAASSNADFTLTVYDTSDALIAPFEGVFPSFEAANFTLEISTILAMIVYGIGGFIFIYLARNFEGFSVNPGTKPSGPPAISQNPSQPQMQQPQPVQQVPQPMPQPQVQQPQPMSNQPMSNQPMSNQSMNNQPMGDQTSYHSQAIGQQPVGGQPQLQPELQPQQIGNPPMQSGQPENTSVESSSQAYNQNQMAGNTDNPTTNS